MSTAFFPDDRFAQLAVALLCYVGVVEVRDNGPGIPAHELPRLFEPFRTTKSSGTGLGLPIARRIVDAHGGRVAVESAPGTNTVFRVELPLVR